MNHEILPYAQIAPNAYNPNVMTERVYRAEMESIAHFGFIDPITVREIAGTDIRPIIDGEHRWRGFGELRNQWLENAIFPRTIDEDEIEQMDEDEQRRNAQGFHPSLLSCFEGNELPVVNLGALPDADAKKLTIILNETRGKANTVDLAALLAEIGVEIGGEALGVGLPFNPDELAQLVASASYDWEAAKSKRESSENEAGESEGESKPDEMLTFTVELSVAGNAFVQQAVQIVSNNGMLPKCEIASDPNRALGQAIETLAREFLRLHSTD